MTNSATKAKSRIDCALDTGKSLRQSKDKASSQDLKPRHCPTTVLLHVINSIINVNRFCCHHLTSRSVGGAAQEALCARASGRYKLLSELPQLDSASRDPPYSVIPNQSRAESNGIRKVNAREEGERDSCRSTAIAP